MGNQFQFFVVVREQFTGRILATSKKSMTYEEAEKVKAELENLFEGSDVLFRIEI